MPTKIGEKTFELAHYKKLPDDARPDGTSSEACPAVQDGGLKLARNPLEVYVFGRMVEERVPSESSWDGYDTEMVERDFNAYRCQYLKRDIQPLCKNCEIRTGNRVFVGKI